MENLLTELWLPTLLAWPIVFLVSLIGLVVLYKIIKGLVSKFLTCPLSRACEFVCTKLWVKCGCKKCPLAEAKAECSAWGCCGTNCGTCDFDEGSCTKGKCCDTCLPVKIVLTVITIVATLTAFGIVAGLFGLTGVSGILTAIVGVLGSILAYFSDLVKVVLLLIPQAVAVYLAGRAIYKGPQFVYDEVYTFVTTTVKGLWNKAVSTVDNASDTVIGK